MMKTILWQAACPSVPCWRVFVHDAPSSVVQALQSAWSRQNHNALVQQDCITPLLPVGFVIKIVIWSSWGDPFYVGLSGLEVHDAVIGNVPIDAGRIGAAPLSSVAQLPTMSSDARTIEKLVCASLSRWCPLARGATGLG
jgi:hypothetical protein